MDKRSDIWAFGCVLYEMLTAKRAFAGDEVSDVLASVLAREPDWTLLPRGLSPVLNTFLKRCLQKDRRQRIGDAQSLRLALEGAFETASEGTQGPAIVRRRREKLTWIAVSVLLALALALSFLRPRPLTPTPSEMRVEITTPATSSPLHFALSPDGGRLVFVASAEGQPRLWVRAFDAVAAQPLAGTENAEYPFWSPDSRSIGFFAEGKLKRSDIVGGPSQVLADATGGRGGTGTPTARSCLPRRMAVRCSVCLRGAASHRPPRGSLQVKPTTVFRSFMRMAGTSSSLRRGAPKCRASILDRSTAENPGV